MKNNKNQQFDDIFDDRTIGKTLKRAKRITLLRTVIISTVVCVVVLFCFYQANLWWVDKKATEVMAELQADLGRDPNTLIEYETVDEGFLGGTITQEVYKVIEDKIIHWDTQVAHYGINGFKYKTFSSSSTQADVNTMIHIPNGEKEMFFYVPQFQYESYANDLIEIGEYPSDKYIELGISFNKGYSLNEVKEMLPKSVHQAWYWVNDYTDNVEIRNEPEFGAQLGIYAPYNKLGQEEGSVKIETEEDYLALVKDNMHISYYKQLKSNQKNGLIIGVVVTGTKENLLELKGKPFIKAASIGAVVDKY